MREGRTGGGMFTQEEESPGRGGIDGGGLMGPEGGEWVKGWCGGGRGVGGVKGNGVSGVRVQRRRGRRMCGR